MFVYAYNYDGSIKDVYYAAYVEYLPVFGRTQLANCDTLHTGGSPETSCV